MHRTDEFTRVVSSMKFHTEIMNNQKQFVVNGSSKLWILSRGNFTWNILSYFWNFFFVCVSYMIALYVLKYFNQANCSGSLNGKWLHIIILLIHRPLLSSFLIGNLSSLHIIKVKCDFWLNFAKVKLQLISILIKNVFNEVGIFENTKSTILRWTSFWKKLS